jgi:dTMP kinase
MAEAGKLIVLEGVEGAALGALAERLCRWLRGQGVAAEHTRQPTSGPAGAQVRLVQQGRLSLDPVSLALLGLADRLDHLEHEGGILAWLAEGHHVLCVRYALYAYACQWGQVKWDWLRRIDAACRVPDLTLYVDGPLSPAGEAQRLRAGYLGAIERLRDEGQAVVVVAGQGAPDVVYQACQRHLADLLDLSLSADPVKG